MSTHNEQQSACIKVIQGGLKTGLTEAKKFYEENTSNWNTRLKMAMNTPIDMCPSTDVEDRIRVLVSKVQGVGYQTANEPVDILNKIVAVLNQATTVRVAYTRTASNDD